MASLRELQRSFAAALRDPAVACAVLPPANLAVYRNNAGITFREALAFTYPVVRRRVGDDYFRQLSAQYRARHPSRSGDLHWVGREFAHFLDEQLSGGDYAWLADLARIEWARAECAVASEAPSLGVDALGKFSTGDLEGLVFGLQPSMYLLASEYPVFTVWLANQEDNAPPVDQSLGKEQGLVRIRGEYSEVRKLEPAVFAFLESLAQGTSLGAAMTRANLDARSLTGALAFLFNEGLVCSIDSLAARPATQSRR